jgi:hypothetical protein
MSAGRLQQLLVVASFLLLGILGSKPMRGQIKRGIMPAVTLRGHSDFISDEGTRYNPYSHRRLFKASCSMTSTNTGKLRP